MKTEHLGKITPFIPEFLFPVKTEEKVRKYEKLKSSLKIVAAAGFSFLFALVLSFILTKSSILIPWIIITSIVITLVMAIMIFRIFLLSKDLKEYAEKVESLLEVLGLKNHLREFSVLLPETYSKKTENILVELALDVFSQGDNTSNEWKIADSAYRSQKELFNYFRETKDTKWHFDQATRKTKLIAQKRTILSTRAYDSECSSPLND